MRPQTKKELAIGISRIYPTQNEPDFWYEWGDEPRGLVSTGRWNGDLWESTGMRNYEEVKHLKMYCPYP